MGALATGKPVPSQESYLSIKKMAGKYGGVNNDHNMLAYISMPLADGLQRLDKIWCPFH